MLPPLAAEKVGGSGMLAPEGPERRGYLRAITASVVLYKSPEAQVLRLFECLSRSSRCPELFIIDNSPEPTSLPFDRPAWVHYTHSRANRGYGAGHNVALREVLDSSEFHFVLNPDVSFEDMELEKMLTFMYANPDIGQLMPRVTYPDGSLQYLCKLLPTPIDLFLRRFMIGPLGRLAERQMHQFELRFTRYEGAMDVPYLSGCFMLFRVRALQEVGLFDERFFMYAEDIDMTRRVNARFRTVFFPGATIIHEHARDSYKSARAFRAHATNVVKYFNKWGWFSDPERARVNRETLRQLERGQE